MIKASINKKTFEIEPTEKGFIVDGHPVEWDLAKIEAGYFHILYQNKSYTAEIVNADHATKTFVVKINGRVYPVEVKYRFVIMLEKMVMNASSAGKVNTVKARMTGLIIDLKIKIGDEVKAGDPLLILEALKMENIIKSPGVG